MDAQCDADINNAKTQIHFNLDIQNVHLIKDCPFNLQGGRLWFFSIKNILITNVAEKNILILVSCNIKFWGGNCATKK
jgi:hypothetical protein